jgi:predicted aspartyl protease
MEDSSTGLGQNLVGQSLIAGYQYAIDDKAGRVDLHKLASAGQQKFDPLYDVPCVTVQGRDIITVDVNGRPMQAFIDTGADSTIIDVQTAQRLGIELSGEVEHMVGVGGGLTTSLAYIKIRMGPIVRSDFKVRVGGEAGCCIGQDFMRGWRCTVDRQHGLVHFFH